MDQLTEALKTAVDEQMNSNVTTFIEVVLNQELGEPFRRDAMKTPVAVAGIDTADMQQQEGAPGHR
jgi:sulfoacetaldehyde acetyltransferase